jgi:HEAT repeat protein
MNKTEEIQKLIDTLKNGERDMQAKAAAQLTQMGLAAAEPLRELTTHPELRVRMLAIMALSEIEN